MTPSTFYIQLVLPVWASTLTLTVTLGPIADATTTLWAIVQRSKVAGVWEDVGGLSASGNKATSSATTFHSCNSATIYRLASNVPNPTYVTVVA